MKVYRFSVLASTLVFVAHIYASKLTAETQAAESSTTSSTPGAAAQPATLLIAQASTEQPDESATPRQQPVTRKTALAPGAVRAVDRPTASAAKKIQSETAKQTTRAKAAEEKTEKKIVKPAPSQPPPTPAQVSEEARSEGPPALTKEEIPPPPVLHSTPSSDMKPAAKEPPVDDSIRTLTGPPAALKTKPTAPEAATSPPAKVAPPEPPAASPPRPPSALKLTAVNAMDIADIEARTRGYNLDEYQLPKAEYNAANDTWSVSYTGRDAEGRTKKFNVVVQDKSGKAEVKK